MKREYKAPTIISESIKIGVFGNDYGSPGACNGFTGADSGSAPTHHFNWGWFFVSRYGRHKR